MGQVGLDDRGPFGHTGVARHRYPPWGYGRDATAHTMPHRGVSCHLFDDVVPSFFKNLLQKVLPPPHHVGAPEATGRMLQIGEPSMDGMRHDRPPSPPAWWIAASLSRQREWCTHEMLHAWGGPPKADQPRWPSRRLWRIISEVP